MELINFWIIIELSVSVSGRRIIWNDERTQTGDEDRK